MSKKAAAPQTPKKTGKQNSRRKQQPLLDLPPIDMDALSLDESKEPSTKMMMMNLLVDINSRLAANEQRVESLVAEKDARPQSLSQAPANPILTFIRHP